MKSILDPSFLYTPSHATDVRKTFERVRLETKAPAPAPRKLLLVLPLPISGRHPHVLREVKP
jgi:hypothetical protein